MQATDHPLRIDIVVHGRFYAFDLARALLARGHDVLLYTNYPKSVVARFGVPPSKVVSCLRHGIASRILYRLMGIMPFLEPEPFLQRWFGSWASGKVRLDADAIHIFSGVAEEVFLRLNGDSSRTLKFLVRGSAHIREQHRLLAEEESRCGHHVEKPSAWMIAREEREYQLADQIIVLSSFAKNSFAAGGVEECKLVLLPLGADVSRFKASKEVVENRRARIVSGEPLRVLMVGSFTPQKGALDFIKIAKELHGKLKFRFVGSIPNDCFWLRDLAGDLIEFIPRVPEFELPDQYEWGDIFVFPTIQDGYAVVIAQALVSALPILATENCSGPDIVKENANGWVFPIRTPEEFIEQLEWCDKNRGSLSAMLGNYDDKLLTRDWVEVAADFEKIVETLLSKATR